MLFTPACGRGLSKHLCYVPIRRPSKCWEPANFIRAGRTLENTLAAAQAFTWDQTKMQVVKDAPGLAEFPSLAGNQATPSRAHLPAACLDSILALTRLASDKTASSSGRVPRGLRIPASLNSWGLGSQLKMEIICHHPSLLKHYKVKFV